MEQAEQPSSTHDARRLLPGPEGSAAVDRIAALAARLLSAPSAQVSLLTEVQTVAGGAGLPPGTVGGRGPLADSLCTVTASLGAPLVVPTATTVPRVSTLPPVTSGAVASYLGVPLTGDSGAVIGALCVFEPAPHRWTDADVTTLQQLAESVQAELELAALGADFDLSRARWELAVEAGEIGSFDWDLLTGELVWDERLIAMYGYDEGDASFDRSIASVEARVHPDDAELIATAMGDAIAAVASLHVLYRIVVPGRGVRWLEARGRALAGPDGTASRLLGVSWDVTAQQESEARADRVLASMSVGYLAMDADWRVTYVNAEGARLLGAGPMRLVGALLWDLFPDTVGTAYEQTYRRVARTGTAETMEAFYPAPLNAWYEIRVAPDDGGVSLYFLDVTERRESAELLQVSVEVSQQMVGAIDAEAAVATLARAVVPRLADFSVVTLVDRDGRWRDVEPFHVEPALRPALERYAATRFDGGGSGAVDGVIASAEPLVLSTGVLQFGLDRLHSDVAKDALRALAPESAAVVPMVADDRVAGVLTLVRGGHRPPLTQQELDVVVTLCRRAGLAIDNARLYAEQAARAEHDRTVAQALQRALLTTLPQTDHLRLVARYVTAVDGDQVGGDWYDALVQPDGSTTVVIGDVMGHDIRATAAMGQLRTMLRVQALRVEDTPATLLANLDRATHDLDVGTFATVVAARIEVAGDGDGPGVRALRWSNAGHPPPVLVHADGTVEVLDDGPVDLMIGVRRDVVRHDHAHPLPPGSTLLLYTDGLVETREADLDEGITRLTDALSRHRALEPEAMLDRVFADTVGDTPADDVAVLAVRLD